MKLKKFVKKNYKKALAAGAAIGGIITVDKVAKATRKIGKKDSHEFAHTVIESIIDTVGTLAWMITAYYLWNKEDDDDLTEEQFLNIVRTKTLDRMVEIKAMIEDPDRDQGDLIEAIYDVKELYETGRVTPDETEAINKIHHNVTIGDYETALDEAAKMIDRVASGEMHLSMEQNSPNNIGTAGTVDDITIAVAAKREEFDKTIAKIRSDLKAGTISAIDATTAAMDAMEKAGIDDEDMEQRFADEFARTETDNVVNKEKGDTSAHEQP